MKITQEVREYASKLGVSEDDAITNGMELKAKELVKQGTEIYKKA